jgi:uncharacterized coiled-coil protein SlyX
VQERRIADLELRLLEKEQHVRALQEHLDDARLEVVRAMAKLQTLATRADAASGMAEAEIALRGLPQTADAQGVKEARGLMQLSTTEFNRQNYAGALYLANQAKSAASVARQQFEGPGTGALRPGEQAFAVPLPLETNATANVRGGPGLTFDIQFVLPADAPVTAYSSVQQWLKVTDASGRRGWISQSLIRPRQ